MNHKPSKVHLIDAHGYSAGQLQAKYTSVKDVPAIHVEQHRLEDTYPTDRRVRINFPGKPEREATVVGHHAAYARTTFATTIPKREMRPTVIVVFDDAPRQRYSYEERYVT